LEIAEIFEKINQKETLRIRGVIPLYDNAPVHKSKKVQSAIL